MLREGSQPAFILRSPLVEEREKTKINIETGWPVLKSQNANETILSF